MVEDSKTPYAGDLSPAEGWDILASNPRAALVDVRTVAEWSYVGVPDLAALSRRPIFVEWQTWPTMAVADHFVADLEGKLAAAGVAKDDPIVFVCRSGVRSLSAALAMTAAGWGRCYNLAGGFEGPLDAERHRGGTAGWKATGLPWIQS